MICAGDVHRRAPGQMLLERTVLRRNAGIASKAVANGQMIDECGAVSHTHIQVMRGQSGRTLKCFPAADSQVPAVRIAESLQARDDRPHIRERRDHRVDIDDGFGCEPRDRRAAEPLTTAAPDGRRAE